MLHASEALPLTKANLQHNDRPMINLICSIKPEGMVAVRPSELLAKLELEKYRRNWSSAADWIGSLRVTTFKTNDLLDLSKNILTYILPNLFLHSCFIHYL